MDASVRWVWQQPGWPNLTLAKGCLDEAERKFAKGMATQKIVLGHLDERTRDGLRVEWLTREALTTSAIEGEMLDRDSIQDSLLRRLGLRRNSRRHGKEEGVAEMMVSLYRYFDQPLDQETLFDWHRMLMSGRRDLDVVGGYRKGEDDMLIVSGGPIGSETIHYQAPPARDVPEEMHQFVEWFNRATGNRPAKSILAVTAATHARFESIHPFEDGNGRIGRAIAEKAMARMIGRPTMLPLAAQIEQSRKAYGSALNSAQVGQGVSMTKWAKWFAQTALDAQDRGERILVVVLTKARVFDQFGKQLNERQHKVLKKLFDAEPEGFKGGLSADNYRKITKAPTSSITRELAAMVEMGILTRQGERRHTRYWLRLPSLNSLMEEFGRGSQPAPSEVR